MIIVHVANHPDGFQVQTVDDPGDGPSTEIAWRIFPTLREAHTHANTISCQRIEVHVETPKRTDLRSINAANAAAFTVQIPGSYQFGVADRTQCARALRDLADDLDRGTLSVLSVRTEQQAAPGEWVQYMLTMIFTARSAQ